MKTKFKVGDYVLVTEDAPVLSKIKGEVFRVDHIEDWGGYIFYFDDKDTKPSAYEAFLELLIKR